MKRLLLATTACTAAFLGGSWAMLPTLPLVNGEPAAPADLSVPSRRTAFEPLEPILLPPSETEETAAVAGQGNWAAWLKTATEDEWFDLDLTTQQPATGGSLAALPHVSGTATANGKSRLLQHPIDSIEAAMSEIDSPVQAVQLTPGSVSSSARVPSIHREEAVPLPDEVPAASPSAPPANRVPALTQSLPANRTQPAPPTHRASQAPVLGQSRSAPAAQSMAQQSVTQRNVRKVSSSGTVWTPFARSGQGNPLHQSRVGQGSVRVLVIGGLQGNDRLSVVWMDELAAELDRSLPVGLDREILLIRAANPDGLLKNKRTNARGVDLNRNFPSKHFRLSPADQTGTAPGSEAETQAILTAISEFDPQAVVTISATSGQSRVLASALATPAAMTLEQQFEATVEPLPRHQLGGSLEDYADATLDAAVLRLELEAGSDWKSSWSRHRELILAALRVGPRGVGSMAQRLDAQPTGTAQAGTVNASTTNTGVSAGTNVTPSAQPAHRLPGEGYEELPAPEF